MTTVPSKGVLAGFRGFNNNARSDVLPPQSSKDFTYAIEALKSLTDQTNNLTDKTMDDLIAHITNYNNPHKLDFTAFYPLLKKAIYNYYVEYFDSTQKDTPLSYDDFLTAVSTNPLMLCEMIRLAVRNTNYKETNPSNAVDITQHAKMTDIGIPTWAWSRLISNCYDYPYNNDLTFAKTTITLDAGEVNTLLNQKYLKTEFVPLSSEDAKGYTPTNVTVDGLSSTPVSNSTLVTQAANNPLNTATLRALPKLAEIGTLSGLSNWSSRGGKIYQGGRIADNASTYPETLLWSLKIKSTDLAYIESANPMPCLLYMYSAGDGFIIAPGYQDGVKQFIIRSVVVDQDGLFATDDAPLIINVKTYRLSMVIRPKGVKFKAFTHGHHPKLDSYSKDRGFSIPGFAIDTSRFVLTNIRLKEGDHYAYDDQLNSDRFLVGNQKDVVHTNYLEIHNGQLNNEILLERLSSSL